MVNARLCETARLAFFFVSLRHFDFLDCETKTSKCLTPSYKKMRLRDARSRSKNETARPVKFD